MARRGDDLREHILYTAKSVFLEAGFERASMDLVAARAETSKRTLYAHFESKERLFLEVVELVRGLFLGKVKRPEDYSAEPLEALTLFCGRYLEMLLYQGTVQMCRVTMAETVRFPEGAAQFFDVMFAQPEERLVAYLATTFGLDAGAARAAGLRLLGQVLHPRYPRALFGLERLIESFDAEKLSPAFDLAAIREAVMALVAGLPAAKPRAGSA